MRRTSRARDTRPAPHATSSATPWYEPGSAAGRLEPLVAPHRRSRNASRPTVSASSDVEAGAAEPRRRAETRAARAPPGSRRRRGRSARRARGCAASGAAGVSTATGISCSKVVPVDVRSLTRCASPATHGYGIAIDVRPRWRERRASGSRVNAQYASSTVTCAMVTGSGPSFSTERSMPSRPSVARSIASRSTGGAPCGRSRSAGAVRTISATSAASSTSGPSATSPAGQTAARRAASQVSRRASTASNMPIQPSSANSLWCAWNMNGPG